MTIDFDDLPPLEEYCDCNGGIIYSRGNNYPGEVISTPCPHCVDGKCPSEFGRAVLELVVKYAGKVSLT